MSLPVTTPEQREQALAKAAAARQVRAAAKASLGNGTITLAAVLYDEDCPLQQAKVSEVLRALPGIGNAKAASLMEEIGIRANRRVKGLGSVQRRALAERFAVAR